MARMWTSHVMAVIVVLGALPGARAGTITGTVVDGHGQSIEGATVYLCSLSGGRDDKAAVVATATTGAAEGAFRIEHAGHNERYGVRSSNVVAWKPGLSMDGVKLMRAPEPLRFELLEPAAISGRIINEQRQPVVGATIAPHWCRISEHPRPDYRSFNVPQVLQDKVKVQTDDEGRFELRCTHPDSRTRLTITAEGYQSVKVSDEAVADGLVMKSVGSVVGRIIAPEGVDLRRARLQASMIGRVYRGPRFLHEAAAADGAFEFPELLPGEYDLTVSNQPSDDYHVRGRRVIVHSGEETTLQLQAERTAVLRGRVVGADTGEGLAEAYISIRQDRYRVGDRSAEDGSFAIACLAGESRIRVSGVEGYRATPVYERIAVNVTAEGADVGDVELQPAYSIRFEVVDEEGDPVEGAVVKYGREDHHFVSSSASEPSNADGRCAVQDLGAGETVKGYAKKDSLLSERVTVVQGEAEEPVTLVLKPDLGAGITAVLVDGGGAPMTDAEVICYEHGEVWVSYMRSDAPDEDGGIAAMGLVPGWRYRFGVKAPGTERVNTQWWRARRGETHDFGTIVLKRHTGVVGGVVVDGDGEPVGGARVFNVGDVPKHKKVSTRTDAHGRFRLEGLVAGDAYVFVEHADYRFAGALAPVGTEDLRIALQAYGPPTMGDPPPPREPQLPKQQARTLAKRLLTEALEQTRGSTAASRTPVLMELAEIDASAAYEEAIAGGDALGPVFLTVGANLLDQDFDEALALMKQADEPIRIVWALNEKAEEMMEETPDFAQRCLQEALAVAQNMENTGKRIVYTADVAKRLEDFEPDRARAILDGLVPVAQRLPTSQWSAAARRDLALRICERHLEKAIALVQTLEQQNRDRHMGKIARRMAATDPERALEIARDRSSDWARDEALAKVLPFLPEDRHDEALEIARGLEDAFSRGYALARMASVVPREQAAGIIEEAAQTLQEASKQHLASEKAEALACLAILARRMGYERWHAITLRALALRTRGGGDWIGPAIGEVRSRLNIMREFRLARLLAFSDREAARHVTESALAYGGGVAELDPRAWDGLAAAAAEVDIDWGVDLLRQMPADDPSDDELPRSRAVLAAVERLLDEPEQRDYQVLTGHHQWNWIPWIPIDEDR